MREPLPEWLRAGRRLSGLRPGRTLLKSHNISSVCDEARCPNRDECFSKPTAAFMILGDTCTRGCGFCSVSHGRPLPPDPHEPERLAEAAAGMGLRHVVITSVTRDDLPDGGAGQFADAILAVRDVLPEASIEVLVPDFRGSSGALEIVLNARPDVLNHNIETVPSLYPTVRPEAYYERSLELLGRARALSGAWVTKSGLMLGLGESEEEVLAVLADLRRAGTDSVTIGQYLRPGRRNLPVERYLRPEEFDALGQRALDMGFKAVVSSPLARSSMNAGEIYNTLRGRG